MRLCRTDARRFNYPLATVQWGRKEKLSQQTSVSVNVKLPLKPAAYRIQLLQNSLQIICGKNRDYTGDKRERGYGNVCLPVGQTVWFNTESLNSLTSWCDNGYALKNNNKNNKNGKKSQHSKTKIASFNYIFSTWRYTILRREKAQKTGHRFNSVGNNLH